MPDYEVFGLRLRADLDLPELRTAAAPAEPDVLIRAGGVPPPESVEAVGYGLRPEGTILSIPEAGRYWISGGCEIAYEPAPGSSLRNLRLFMLGSALGALLHQRGLLPLHANAVEIGGRAVAFMGHSGAGKSTLANWFSDRGYRILADDVCVVTFDPEGRPVAHNGIPRVRLWREALEASGRDPSAYQASFDDMDKYDVPTGAGEAASSPLPLAAVYHLARAEAPAIRPLQGVEAAQALIANTYRGGYVTLSGRTERHFRDCMRLVAGTKLFLAERAWGYDRFDAEAELLEAHARAVAGAI